MNHLLIDAAQTIITSGYAVLLDRYKHYLEPEGTWLEVVIGNALCLGFADLHRRARRSATAAQTQHDVWRAFAVGGLPIILWRLYRAYTMHQRGFELAIRHLRGDAHAESSQR